MSKLLPDSDLESRDSTTNLHEDKREVHSLAKSVQEINSGNKALAEKYRKTSQWYDLLDAYWERQYQKIRPLIISDLSRNVLEVGVGTGRNLSFYRSDVQLTAVDLSPEMLAIAKTRAPSNLNPIFMQADATLLEKIPSSQFDWYVATFLYCVMPDQLQPAALNQMLRVLKPNGKFRIIELVYSKETIPYLKQKFFSAFVERVYGARFDRQTLRLIKTHPSLKITRRIFLKGDTLLLIEGEKAENKESFLESTGHTVESEKLAKETITSWGSKMAVVCVATLSLLKQGKLIPSVALLSCDFMSTVPLVSALNPLSHLTGLFYTGISAGLGFFLSSRCAQELAEVRAEVGHRQAPTDRVLNPNRFILQKSGKAAICAMAGEFVGAEIAGPLGAAAGAAIGAYLGAKS